METLIAPAGTTGLQGWDAVLVLDRDKLNAKLSNQFCSHGPSNSALQWNYLNLNYWNLSSEEYPFIYKVEIDAGPALFQFGERDSFTIELVLLRGAVTRVLSEMEKVPPFHGGLILPSMFRWDHKRDGFTLPSKRTRFTMSGRLSALSGTVGDDGQVTLHVGKDASFFFPEVGNIANLVAWRGGDFPINLGAMVLDGLPDNLRPKEFHFAARQDDPGRVQVLISTKRSGGGGMPLLNIPWVADQGHSVTLAVSPQTFLPLLFKDVQFASGFDLFINEDGSWKATAQRATFSTKDTEIRCGISFCPDSGAIGASVFSASCFQDKDYHATLSAGTPTDKVAVTFSGDLYVESTIQSRERIDIRKIALPSLSLGALLQVLTPGVFFSNAQAVTMPGNLVYSGEFQQRLTLSRIWVDLQASGEFAFTARLDGTATKDVKWSVSDRRCSISKEGVLKVTGTITEPVVTTVMAKAAAALEQVAWAVVVIVPG